MLGNGAVEVSDEKLWRLFCLKQSSKGGICMSMNYSGTAVMEVPKKEEDLSRVLKPIHLWSLAVGLVISGNYFGWSYGFAEGGVMGLA